MPIDSASTANPKGTMFLLGIDTCGPEGSVALGWLTAGGGCEILAQKELEGRSYSATLVSAVGELLAEQGIGVGELGCIVVVNGPGSFTGVRVGLSAAKGLAEGAEIPVAAVSRLEVLARKAGVLSAALDAHRHEVFLRVEDGDHGFSELLAGVAELSLIPAPPRVAICDDAAGVLLRAAWPDTVLSRVDAPTATDALELAASGVVAGEFFDVALLDGHYLRRSDAEIFGAPAVVTSKSA